MKWTIKAGLTRTFALRQYENIKPNIEIELEFDTDVDKEFNMEKTLVILKTKCEDYINKFNPESQELPFN